MLCVHLYMVSWFEKSKEVIVSQGQSKDEAVMNMVEDLFDLLMVNDIDCYRACDY